MDSDDTIWILLSLGEVPENKIAKEENKAPPIVHSKNKIFLENI